MSNVISTSSAGAGFIFYIETWPWRFWKLFSDPWAKLLNIAFSEYLYYSDVIMGVRVSQITSLTIVYSTVYSSVNQRKHQSSASLAFVWGIHRWPVNSPHKWPVTRKIFPFDDVIMCTQLWCWYSHMCRLRCQCTIRAFLIPFLAFLILLFGRRDISALAQERHGHFRSPFYIVSCFVGIVLSETKRVCNQHGSLLPTWINFAPPPPPPPFPPNDHNLKTC